MDVTENKGWTALHFSVMYGSYELFRYFADMGVDINIKSNNGWNCLHIAALYQHLNLCKILIDKHRFDMHMTDNKGFTALHVSVKYGSYELFRYFADMGVDINIKSNDGLNCLHIAAGYGHLNHCKILIDKHKFDMHMTENKGFTALHFSVKCGGYELFTYFADMGVEINIQGNNGLNCLHIASRYGHLNLCKILMEKQNFHMHMADNDGYTALHYCVEYGSYELFRYFVDMGVDINIKRNGGWNCLHIASLHGHLHLCKILIDRHNFDVNVTENKGWTALHYSVRYGSFE